MTANKLFKFEFLLVYYIGTYYASNLKDKIMSTNDLVELTGKSYMYVARELMKVKKAELIELVKVENNKKYYRLTKKGKNVYSYMLKILSNYEYNIYSVNAHKVVQPNDKKNKKVKK